MNMQNTDKWHGDRCGMITASRLSDCLAVTPDKWKVIRASGTTLKVCDNEADCIEAFTAASEKKPGGFTMEFCPGAPLVGWQTYQDEIVCERLTGEVKMIGEPPAIRWGNDHESYGVSAYEIKTGRIIEDVAFIPAIASTGLVKYGASPDGKIQGEAGGIEIKCPLVSTRHLRCFVDGIPKEHWPQMEGQMLATGWGYVDFVSYDPRFSGDYEHLQIFICRYVSQPELRANIVAAINRMEAGIIQLIAGLPGPGEV